MTILFDTVVLLDDNDLIVMEVIMSNPAKTPNESKQRDADKHTAFSEPFYSDVLLRMWNETTARALGVI